MSTQQDAREVVLEVAREGRRPRYHRGARLEGGPLAKPEQCNLDQVVATITELDALPEVYKGGPLQHPWSQLCRRCWAGTEVWAKALELLAAYRERKAARRAVR